MRYTKEERLEIGRKVDEGIMTRYEAAEDYGISDDTARDYMRMYRDSNSLPPKSSGNNTGCYVHDSSERPLDISDYESMTKEELILELIKARVAEARLKKGYEVKGDGQTKEYILLDSSNTK
ncbi:hypothetical protein [Cloacibacillus sp. An23]|uniref:hypothetical protein n=1 Tax=Cloacibacillus sp. An23 TaxID=1965591 RepID=UPI000B36DA39|nr:hypothetical protein [Cloacibacillus sp. An23]OUO94701.1 hypothetical protein B5F39_02205 [Cloacibacillus sp. An23]